MSLKLKDGQLEAVKKLRNGSILCGGVGSGKSITSLWYYLVELCGGSVYPYRKMRNPRDLYIITTAMKRDSKEWLKECSNFALAEDRELSHSGVKVTIDSWNNIKKYKDMIGAFFIFDEQRLVGSGAWVKTFLNIARKNRWILLSATPGDTYIDYVPVLVANGFYRNKSEFQRQHCVFSRYAKFPKIERYIGTETIDRYLAEIIVPMKVERDTIRHEEYVKIHYDKALWKTVMKDRWNPYDNEPIQETGKLLYLMRRVANDNAERLEKLRDILFDPNRNGKVILFYNFSYELYAIKDFLDSIHYRYAEWNGEHHEDVPKTKRWVYLVQYLAGSEGWNCITTDTIIFFSLNYSYRTMEQAAGRIDRINTPFRDLYYYYFISSAPIDLAIMEALRRKEKFNERNWANAFL